MLGFGLGLGLRKVYLSGIDLYESKEARYGYTVSQKVAAGLLEKDLEPGYEDTHSIDNDLAFLQVCLAEFPDADVYSLSESVNRRCSCRPARRSATGRSSCRGSTSALARSGKR